jgi:hypothetical protein
MKRINPHLTYPLRRIVRREIQDGRPVIVLACQHAVPGVPSSRYAKFNPCRVCYERVEEFKASQPRNRMALGSDRHPTPRINRS